MDWNLEKVPLKFKIPGDTIGSDQEVKIYFRESSTIGMGSFHLQLKSNIRWKMPECQNSFIEFEVQPTLDNNQLVWTIQKSESNFTVLCNGIMMVVQEFTGSACISKYSSGKKIAAIKIERKESKVTLSYNFVAPPGLSRKVYHNY